MAFDVQFLDAGRTAQCAPDPAFPEGRRINLASNPVVKTCTRNLPYPAPRCGTYVVVCKECGYTGAVTVAGRPDDHRMITMPCWGALI
jgi:hypothetical protein